MASKVIQQLKNDIIISLEDADESLLLLISELIGIKLPVVLEESEEDKISQLREQLILRERALYLKGIGKSFTPLEVREQALDYLRKQNDKL